MIDNIPVAVFVKDARTLEIVRVNEAGARLFGYPREFIEGKTVHDFFPRDQAEAFDELDRRVLRSRLPAVIPFEVMQRQKGDTRVLRTQKIPVYCPKTGEPMLLLAIFEDLTDLRRTGEALDTRTRELEATVALMEDFTYSAAHQLRGPLRAIDGFALVAQHDCKGPRSQRALRRVRANAQRMAELIDSLLELSRLARKPLKREALNFAEEARAAAERVKARRPEDRVLFVCPEGRKVVADREALGQALEHLLDNAWKYSKDHPRPRVEVGTDEIGSMYYVRDNGAGFRMSQIRQLFMPFRKLDFSVGRGMGLALARRAIERHGGKLWAVSRPGRGSTFFFTLPRSEA